jgi:hypothetical protein
MVLTNMGVFLTILLGFTMQKLFFGHLRAIEEAHLRERIWFAVTETFLAMTVFRDEFNTGFVVMFISLLFVKCFHWICQDRIDYVLSVPYMTKLTLTDGAVPNDTVAFSYSNGVRDDALPCSGYSIYQSCYRRNDTSWCKYDDNVRL